MVNEVTKNGMTDCGEILAEAENGKIITDSTEWWMFAESVIGLYNAYQIFGCLSTLFILYHSKLSGQLKIAQCKTN